MSGEAECFACMGEKSCRAWLILLGLCVRTCLKPALVQHWQVWEKEMLVSK